MASTNNKNTPGDYQLEQRAFNKHCEYNISAECRPSTVNFAGNGLLAGPVPSMELSYQTTDIDSYLRGIGSSNLVNPVVYGGLDPENMKHPPVKNIASLNLFHNTPVYIPSPLKMEPNRRPLIN